MLQKIVSSKTLKLWIKCVLKQVQHLSNKEQKEILNFTLKSIKNLMTIISLNSGKLKHKHSLFSKCIAKCKNSDGLYKFVIRRRDHLVKPSFDTNEIKSLDASHNFSDEDQQPLEHEVQDNKLSENISDFDESDSLKEICNFDLHCSLCTNISNNYTILTKHVMSHGGTAISCYKCKQTFNNISIYKIHLNDDCSKCLGMSSDKFLHHFANVVKKYGQKYQLACFCPFCGKSFVKPFNLKRHLKNICGENLNKAEYRCSSCNRTFDHEVKYSEHLQQHNNYKCLNCDWYFPTKKLLKIHSHSHPKVTNNYKCSLCNLQFQNRSQFREHNSIHIKDEQLTPADKEWRVWCNICQISFFDYFTYKRHCTRKSHLSKVTDDKELLSMKTFMCDCGKVFMTKEALSTHCSKKHRDKITLSCDKCPYTTTSKTNLKRHLLPHEGKVPKNVFCDQCPKRFTTSSSLKEHILLAHVEERSFICDMCPKTFKLKNLLNRHKKIHSPALPFVCEYCAVGFKRKSHLTRHTGSRHKEILTKQDSIMKIDNMAAMQMHKNNTTRIQSAVRKNDLNIQNTMQKDIQIAMQNENMGTIQIAMQNNEITNIQSAIENDDMTTIQNTMQNDDMTTIQSSLGETSKLMEPPLPTIPLAIDMKDISENVTIDGVFSLIDAQSGELVTLSATELSKNAVINLSGGELLNDVHISELWNPANTIFTLDPILENNVLPHPEFDIIAQDKNEINNMMQETLEENTTDKNVIQYYIVPPENVESQETNELTYFYV